MTSRQFAYRLIIAGLLLFCSYPVLQAQDSLSVPGTIFLGDLSADVPVDSLVVSDSLRGDSVAIMSSDMDSVESGYDRVVDSTMAGVPLSATLTHADSMEILNNEIQKKRWIPDSKKAMWLAIIFPGGGQIYNRKYWKLPLIYGGFLGCMYALNWNNTMYNDYSQAYVDIMDSDPNTKSYEDFLPSSYDVESNLSRLQSLFQRKKNYYRRYRDLSLFCMIGVYLLSIVDAYVDAELSSFDISPDLSMKVKPTIINDNQQHLRNTNTLSSSSYGLQCSFSF